MNEFLLFVSDSVSIKIPGLRKVVVRYLHKEQLQIWTRESAQPEHKTPPVSFLVEFLSLQA
jgi:hypothetical protein